MKRRRLLNFGASCVFLSGMHVSAHAQQFPVKPIKIIMPYPPGGSTYASTRIIAKGLEERLSQPVILEGKPGAGGMIASDFVAKSPADGHTLLLLTTSAAQAVYFAGKNFDAYRDFSLIGNMLDGQLVIVVNPRVLDVSNLSDLIDKARSGPVNYTSSGIGSTGHLSMELIKNLTGAKGFSHVAYKGSVPAVNDVVGGQLPIMFADANTAYPFIQSGHLRAIAVGSPERLSILPNVKTIREQGIQNFEAVTFFGLAAPPGTPKAVIGKLAENMKSIMEDPLVNSQLNALTGSQPNFLGPKDFSERLDSFYKKWTRVAKENNITLQ